MSNETGRLIMDERATQLEKLGFVLKLKGNDMWYERGDIKIPPTLILGAPTHQWDDYIKKLPTVGTENVPGDNKPEHYKELLKKVLDFFDKDTTNVPEQLYKDVFNTVFQPQKPQS